MITDCVQEEEEGGGETGGGGREGSAGRPPETSEDNSRRRGHDTQTALSYSSPVAHVTLQTLGGCLPYILFPL